MKIQSRQGKGHVSHVICRRGNEATYFSEAHTTASKGLVCGTVSRKILKLYCIFFTHHVLLSWEHAVLFPERTKTRTLRLVSHQTWNSRVGNTLGLAKATPWIPPDTGCSLSCSRLTPGFSQGSCLTA